jgi:hypothetical protein
VVLKRFPGVWHYSNSLTSHSLARACIWLRPPIHRRILFISPFSRMVRKRGGNFQSGSRGRAREHKRPGTYDDVFRTTRHDPRIFPPSATKRQNLESASASGWSAGATFLGLYGSRIRTYSLPSSGRPGRAVVRRSKLRTRSLAGLACHTIRTRQPPFGNRAPDPNLSRGRFVRVGVTHKPSAANSKTSARSVGSVISEGSTGPRPEQSGTAGLGTLPTVPPQSFSWPAGLTI